MSFGEQLLSRLHEVDDRMVASGAYPISPRWWQALERFYLSGKRILTIRKGRQTYASKGICPRLVVATMLVERQVCRGEVRTFAVLSVRRTEALDRLANIAGVLQTMGIPFERSGDTLHVPALRSRVIVLTASFKTAVGDTCDFIWCDEVTRWADESTSSNPAAHVIGSLKPSLVTLPNAKMFLVSSPWTTSDYHARQVDLGDTASQNVEVFTTWEAAPHLTEQQCRDLAGSESEFWREFGAKPNDGGLERLLDAVSVDGCVDTDRAPELARSPKLYCCAGGDFGFARDSSAICIVGYYSEEPDVYHLCAMEEWCPRPGAPLRPSWVAAQFGAVLRRWRQRGVWVDRFDLAPMEELAQQNGYELIVPPEGARPRIERFHLLRSIVLEQRLRLPPDARLVRQLKGITQHLAPGGNVQIELSRSDGSHSDVTSALVLAIDALQRGQARRQATQRSNQRRESVADQLAAREDPNYVPLRERTVLDEGWDRRYEAQRQCELESAFRRLFGPPRPRDDDSMIHVQTIRKL